MYDEVSSKELSFECAESFRVVSVAVGFPLLKESSDIT